MDKSRKLLVNKKILFFNSIHSQISLLFGLIFFTCIFTDFYFKTSNLTIPFIITTLVSSTITFIGIPKLKKFKIKQIIIEEGPNGRTGDNVGLYAGFDCILPPAENQGRN